MWYSQKDDERYGVCYTDRIRVIYKVTLPAGATGAQRAVLSFRDENTNTGDVDLSITAVN